MRTSGASAPASLTGVPTVVGWLHEISYRGRAPFQHRVAAVRTTDTARPAKQATLLRRYDVQYVYAGPAERTRNNTITVDQMVGGERHKDVGAVGIYRVRQDELGE